MDKINNQRQFVAHYIKDNNIDVANKDIYEFGVYTGGSFMKFQRLLIELQIECHSIYGFDSFIGLSESEGMFDIGSFNALTSFKVNSINKVIEILKQQISFSNIPTHFIPGFFKDVLNETLMKQYSFKPAIFVDIDVDIYSATIECLEFLFQNNLIEKGTLIAYDDWGAFKEFKGGESKAHYELMQKYNVITEEIFCYQSPNHFNSVQKVFIVKEIK